MSLNYNKGAENYCHQYNRRLEAKKEDESNIRYFKNKIKSLIKPYPKNYIE